MAGYPSSEELTGSRGWREIMPRVLLTGSARHEFKVQSARRFSHIRLNVFPDGGIARLHVHGEVVPDPALLTGLTIDLAALENGADVVASNDQNYYSPARNVISPGLSRVMHEGWETRRRRRPGHEWLVIRLAGHGVIDLAEIDTSWFRGNQPDTRIAADAERRHRRVAIRRERMARSAAAGQAAAGHPAPVPRDRPAGHACPAQPASRTGVSPGCGCTDR